jgi:hypothetical protein
MQMRRLKQALSIHFVFSDKTAQPADRAVRSPRAFANDPEAQGCMKIDPRALRWVSSPELQPPN